MHVISNFRSMIIWLAALAFVALASLTSLPANAGKVGPNIVLKPNVTNEINKLLFTSESLRSALLSQDEDQIEISLRELSWQVDQARAVSVYVRDFDRRHLLKILDNIKLNLETSSTSYGSYRKEFFSKVFNQLANIVRIYQVDPHFYIYYCPKDNSTWVQSTNKPENPFRSSSVPKDCGMKINHQN